MGDDHITPNTTVGPVTGVTFEIIYQTYYRPLYFFAMELLHDEQEVHDVVADTFVKYYERRADFDDERQIKSFLYTTARHAALNHLRDFKNRTAKAPAIADAITSDNDTFFDKLVLTELIAQIADEVEKLPAMQRQVFSLAYFDGKTTEEIAEALGLHAESVYNNKKRALDKLKLVFKSKDIRLYMAFLRVFFFN